MSKTGFSVTFERYLPRPDGEEVCEPDEIGFVLENVSLREAIQQGLDYNDPGFACACAADSYPARGVRWLTFGAWNMGTREEIEQGINESRALHFPDCLTEASRKRICRMFGVKC